MVVDGGIDAGIIDNIGDGFDVATVVNKIRNKSSSARIRFCTSEPGYFIDIVDHPHHRDGISSTKYDLLKWFIGAIIVQAGFIFGVLKFFH